MEYILASDGRRLAYRDTGGAGPAVLCLPGLSRNSRDFDRLAAHLAPRYRVLRLDARGRGGSERAAKPTEEYTVPVETRDTHDLLDHLGIGRVSVIGTSRGGIVGMSLAAAWPGLVQALVLNDAEIEMRGLLRIMAYLGREPLDGSFAEAAARLKREHARDFPGVPEARWLEHARAIYDDVHGRPRIAYDPKLVAAAAAVDDNAETISLWPLLEGLPNLPILVIRGEHSDILSARTLARMRKVHPGLQAVEIPARGHAPFLDEPAAVAAIDRFLEAHAR